MTLPSHGTLLQIGDGGGTEVFTTIAKIKDISGPTLNRGTHDASTQTTDWSEVVPGLKKGGQFTFDVNFIPTDTTHDHQTGLIKDFIDGTKRNFRIIWPDAGNTIDQYAAYVVNFEPDAPVDGLLTASVTLEITGDPAPQFDVTP
jgi:predicted secreted protein